MFYRVVVSTSSIDAVGVVFAHRDVRRDKCHLDNP